MGVGAGLYMYVVVLQKFTFAISSPDEFLFELLQVVPVSSLKLYFRRQRVSGCLNRLYAYIISVFMN